MCYDIKTLKMRQLDLHGVYHHEVEDIVENFVLLYSTELPIRIITGLSPKMKELTIKVLNKHNFNFHFTINNPGEIIVDSY